MYEFEEQRWRLYALLSVIAIFVLVLAVRLFDIQVLQNARYSALAKKEHWREEVIPARRGTIFDASGHELATSVEFESLYAITNQITNPEKIASALAPIVNVPEADLLARLAVRQTAPVLLKALVPTEEAEAVRKLRIGEVYFDTTFKRAYPEGNIAGQLLGLVGRDYQGLTGIEAAFDADLAGKPGSLLAERDTGGDEIALSPSQYSQPHDGADVVLTIDRYVQRVAERELGNAVKKHRAAGGTIVVMEPSTGAILAIANRPTFAFDDPNLFAPNKIGLYKNPAVADAWEPGSIFKIVTMAAGLDARAVTPDESFNNTGSFAYAGGVVRNVITRLGPETMAQVLQRSSNIGASYVSTKLGAERFYRYVSAFGFGQPTGIEIPGEATGIVRTPRTGNWYPFDLAANSFGQGISVTPIQMVAAVSAAVNGGTLMRPYVVKEVIGKNEKNGRRVYQPTILRQVISPTTSQTLVKMLVSAVEVVEGGQVRMARVPDYQVGGKTGTAQIPTNQGYTSADTIASFVGFGPADEARFVALIKLDSPQDSPWGETTAAPAFKNVAEQLFAYMRVPPAKAQYRDGNLAGAVSVTRTGSP
ncbi:MAG: penicillin-binding protein 2 [Chloroflexi bacterium]|nr:penicillin-binding protein 2 [Chloroflexota bacterium]